MRPLCKVEAPADEGEDEAAAQVTETAPRRAGLAGRRPGLRQMTLRSGSSSITFVGVT